MYKSILFTAAASALMTCGVPALAQTEDDIPTITGIPEGVRWEVVKYGDLDLSSQAGVDTLTSRVRGASKRVCAEDPGDRSLDKFIASRRCFRSSFARAMNQVDNILVAYRTNGGQLAAKSVSIRISR